MSSRFAQIAGLCLSALAVAAASAGSHASQEIEPRDRAPLDTLRDFDGVALGGPDTLLVSRGDGYSVKVEGDPAAIRKLDIYVRNHVLHVERRWHHGESGHDRGATVRVTLPRLRSAVLSGSGDLTIAEIAAQEASFSLAGSGTITARGKVTESRVSLAGSGDVHADQLMAARAHVSIAGSGDAYVHASEGARVSIIGSGDALIRGTTNCQTSRIGSGDVHCST